MSKTYSRTRILIECALLLAIGTILANIKLIDMPFGGSVTLLSMLPFILVSLRHGVKWGVLTGFANALLQMALGFYAPPSGTVLAFAGAILLDYVIAFSVLGTAAFFANFFKNKLLGAVVSTAVVIALRFICHFLTGFLLWASYQEYYDWALDMPAALYSFIYNANYMLPELLITCVVVAILYKIVPQLFAKQSAA